MRLMLRIEPDAFAVSWLRLIPGLRLLFTGNVGGWTQRLIIQISGSRHWRFWHRRLRLILRRIAFAAGEVIADYCENSSKNRNEPKYGSHDVLRLSITTPAVKKPPLKATMATIHHNVNDLSPTIRSSGIKTKKSTAISRSASPIMYATLWRSDMAQRG